MTISSVEHVVHQDVFHTSGWPSWSKNASGTEEEAAVFSEVGLAEYSVSGMPLGTPFSVGMGAMIDQTLKA